MTQVMSGLAALKARNAKVAEQSGSRLNWLKIADGETVDFVFLQELDEASEFYSAENGMARFATEHSSRNSATFFLRHVCTNEEEYDFHCWSCDKNRELWQENKDLGRDKKDDDYYKGSLGPKTNVYFNVLVIKRNDEDVEEIAVLNRKYDPEPYKRNMANDIVDFAEEEGHLGGVIWKIKRTGSGKYDTTYSLRATTKKYAGKRTGFELFDADALFRTVEYGEQAAALGETAAPVRREPIVASEPVSDEDDDAAWD